MKKIPLELLEMEPSIEEIWKLFPLSVRDFWDEVQESLTESLIIPAYQEERFNNGFYANIQMRFLGAEFKKHTGYSRSILLCINKEHGKPYDVAHELAHLAVANIYGYNIIHKRVKPASDSIRKKTDKVLLIYNAAIHPVVDCFLQVKNPHFCKYFSSPLGGEFLCHAGHLSKSC